MIVNYNSSNMLNQHGSQKEITKMVSRLPNETRSYPTVLNNDSCYDNRMMLSLELETFSKNNNHCNISTRCTESLMNLSSSAKPKDCKRSRRTFHKDYEAEEAKILLTYQNNELLKCRYKVMFKTRSNADTKVIVNTLKKKKSSSE